MEQIWRLVSRLQQVEGSKCCNEQALRRKRRLIRRDREEAHDCMYKDYFADDSIYSKNHFRHRLKMWKHLVLRIMEAPVVILSTFRWHMIYYCTVLMNTSYIVATQMLTYGILLHYVDEYFKFGESTLLQCLKNIAIRVIAIIGKSI